MWDQTRPRGIPSVVEEANGFSDREKTHPRRRYSRTRGDYCPSFFPGFSPETFAPLGLSLLNQSGPSASTFVM